MERDFTSAIVVSAVQEEYERVRNTPCTCGGRYGVRGQELVEDQAGRHFDVLLAACGECGLTRDFVFDINAFFRADGTAGPPPGAYGVTVAGDGTVADTGGMAADPYRAPATTPADWSQTAGTATYTAPTTTPVPPSTTPAPPAMTPTLPQPPLPPVPRDLRVLRGTLDLAALIACVFAFVCLLFVYFLPAALFLVAATACWFIPTGWLSRLAPRSAVRPDGQPIR